MPRRKYTKKKTTVARRRRYKSSPRRPILSGFPPSKLVKLRYVDSTLTLNPAAGLTQTIAYRANSVYNPYFPAGGHQPMGFDQWAAIYTRYVVVGAKITVTPTPVSNTAIIPGYFGVVLSTSSTPLSN